MSKRATPCSDELEGNYLFRCVTQQLPVQMSYRATTCSDAVQGNYLFKFDGVFQSKMLLSINLESWNHKEIC